MQEQTPRKETSFTANEKRKTPTVATGMERWLRRSLVALVVVMGAGFASETTEAAKKAPPIAQPMYLEAFTKMVFRKSSEAVKPLTYLISADPNLADVQNALAMALYVSDPGQLEQAHAYATTAVELSPRVPQFIVTKVLTDGAQWKIKGKTARLTTEAAEILLKMSEILLDSKGNAKKLGKILASIKNTGDDPDFPFVFADYKKLLKKPQLVLTRPKDDEFNVAQKNLVEKIFRLKEKLNEDKKLAQVESQKAEEEKAEIESKVAEAAERQRKVEEAQARALKKLQLAAVESAENAKKVAETQRLRQLAAEVEQRKLEEERLIAEAKRAAEEIILAQAETDLAAKAISEAERKAEEERIAKARAEAEAAKQAEELRLAEEEEKRQAEEATRLAEERRLAILKEDEARRAREELALIAKAAEEARKEQEALQLAQQIAHEKAEEAQRIAQEAETAAQASTEELLRQLEEQAKLLEAMLNDAPPLIKVTSSPVSVEIGEGSFQITGVVGDAKGAPRLLTINGERVPLFKLGPDDEQLAEYGNSFRYEATPTAGGDLKFVIAVVDAADNVTTAEVVVKITVANRPNILGKNYALIIGSNDYDNLPTLKTAVNDATTIAQVLQERYDFEEGSIQLLTNATRRDILKALSGFRKNLTTEDRLMLYYAGHGQIDPATEEGFWQPVDAEPENDFTWISNADVKRYLGGIPAKHVLVIADSCFSGSLTRGAETQLDSEDKFFLNIDKYPSRKIIASGGTEPVADSGSGGHSIFAYYLIKTLRDNNKPYITSYQLYDRLVRAVTNNSKQTPEFGTVPDSGDQGSGDFTFILRRETSG